MTFGADGGAPYHWHLGRADARPSLGGGTVSYGHDVGEVSRRPTDNCTVSYGHDVGEVSRRPTDNCTVSYGHDVGEGSRRPTAMADISTDKTAARTEAPPPLAKAYFYTGTAAASPVLLVAREATRWEVQSGRGQSLQYFLRPHWGQQAPRQTASNCSLSGSSRDGSSVKIPFSKLRLESLLAPRPAPVRLALPK